MEAKEIYDRIQALDEQGIGRRDYEAVSELRDVYRLAYGESVESGCGDCIRKAYGKLQLLTFKFIEQMTNSKFKLKEDVLLPIGDFGTSEFLSKANLTDELAYQVLNKFPSLINQFEEYPKDKDGNLLKEGSKPAKIQDDVITPLDGGAPTQEQIDQAKAVLAAAGVENVTPLPGQELQLAATVGAAEDEAEIQADNETLEPEEEKEISYAEYLEGKSKEELQEIYKEEAGKDAPIRWAKKLLIDGILAAQKED